MSEKITFALQVMTPEERAALRAAYPEAESDAEALVRRTLERSGLAERIGAVMPNTDLLAAINAVYTLLPKDEVGISKLVKETFKYFNASTAIANITFLATPTYDPVIAEALRWALREWPRRFDAEVFEARRWLAGEEEEPPTSTRSTENITQAPDSGSWHVDTHTGGPTE